MAHRDVNDLHILLSHSELCRRINTRCVIDYKHVMWSSSSSSSPWHLWDSHCCWIWTADRETGERKAAGTRTISLWTLLPGSVAMWQTWIITHWSRGCSLFCVPFITLLTITPAFWEDLCTGSSQPTLEKIETWFISNNKPWQSLIVMQYQPYKEFFILQNIASWCFYII